MPTNREAQGEVERIVRKLGAAHKPVYVMLYRRGDVRSRISQLRTSAVANMKKAEAEENWPWRENQLNKVRLLNELSVLLEDKCTVLWADQSVLSKIPPAQSEE